MTDRLTHKEKGFVKDVAKGETIVQAALNNYDTEDYMTAANIGSENLKKPKIINALDEALPDELLNEIHREGLYATREYYNSKGELQGDVADFAVRHKYLDSAYKLKGKYAPDKTINVNVEVETSPEVEEATKVLNEHFKGTSISSDGGTTRALDIET